MLNEILDRRHEISIYGLALIPLLAGISKFITPGLWMGYEPEFVRTMIGLSSSQIVLIAGISETLLGAWIATRIYSTYSTAAAFFWLLTITAQVSMLGLWDIAIRDLGLTFYALTVALNEYSRNKA